MKYVRKCYEQSKQMTQNMLTIYNTVPLALLQTLFTFTLQTPLASQIVWSPRPQRLKEERWKARRRTAIGRHTPDSKRW